MNPLKKLKLKSQLRNCDYMLAGTVIKQQYYDSTKSTVINRMIDDFMADPGFENALKLIEYNDMMVFYFTESCEGGLYVRKTTQDSVKPAAEAPRKESKSEFDLESDSPMPVLEDPKKLEREERQRQILQESEEWMEQLLARDPRKNQTPAPAPARIQNADLEPPSDEPELEHATSYKSSFLDETIEFTAIREPESAYAASEVVDLVVEEPAALEAAPAVEPDPIPEYESEPYQEVLPSRTIKKRNYSNVIATLKIDIHTMVKQLDEYRRELSYYPSNEKQLIAWIKSLEEAIEEFSEVVDLLEDND